MRPTHGSAEGQIPHLADPRDARIATLEAQRDSLEGQFVDVLNDRQRLEVTRATLEAQLEAAEVLCAAHQALITELKNMAEVDRVRWQAQLAEALSAPPSAGARSDTSGDGGGIG